MFKASQTIEIGSFTEAAEHLAKKEAPLLAPQRAARRVRETLKTHRQGGPSADLIMRSRQHPTIDPQQVMVLKHPAFR